MRICRVWAMTSYAFGPSEAAGCTPVIFRCLFFKNNSLSLASSATRFSHKLGFWRRHSAFSAARMKSASASQKKQYRQQSQAGSVSGAQFEFVRVERTHDPTACHASAEPRPYRAAASGRFPALRVGGHPQNRPSPGWTGANSVGSPGRRAGLQGAFTAPGHKSTAD
eukprot:COSAG05_NODE_1432_length_4906_cov_7.244227_2_plen_167_part_00